MPGDCASGDELTRDSSQFAKALPHQIRELTLTSNCSVPRVGIPTLCFWGFVFGAAKYSFFDGEPLGTAGRADLGGGKPALTQ
jgi:hypothetical protein